MRRNENRNRMWIIIGFVLLSVGATTASFICKTELEESIPLEVKPEVFFRTDSKIRSAILVNDGKLYFGTENGEF